MGRYRPPEPAKAAIITAQGLTRLQEQLNFLWKEKRPEVTARVAAAAALGDRSKNADYIYGKRQLADIDQRIRYLDKRIRTMQVVDRLPSDTSRIYFGAWVEYDRRPVQLPHCWTGRDRPSSCLHQYRFTDGQSTDG